MTHFRFHSNTAPFPGTCVFSGENRNLWEVGTMTVQGQVLPVLLSDRVLQELADSAGYVTKGAYAQLNAELTEKIRTLEAQTDAVPNLLKELQNDFANLVSNFVTNLSGVTAVDQPVQPQSPEASTGESEAKLGPSSKSGSGKIKTTKPSTDSTVD
jgi:hypothetical protein